MVIAVFIVAGIVVLAGVAMLIDLVVDRQTLGRPAARANGLRDDLQLGIGINTLGGS